VIVTLMDEASLASSLRKQPASSSNPTAAPSPSGEAPQLRYTLDGTEPTAASPLYTTPIELDRSAHLKARAFAKDGTPSRTADATYRLVRTLPGHGLSFTAYRGTFDKLPDLSATTTLSPDRTGTLSDIDLSDFNIGTDEFALRIEGTITIDTPGEYTFSLASDDGSRLLIGG
jgi:hypothetical protein